MLDSRLAFASVIVALALSGCTLNTQGGGEPDAPDAAASDAALDSPTDRSDANPCAQGSKFCDSTCVGIDDPAFGCSLDSCSPCAIAHASARCAESRCSLNSCDQGWGDCNGKVEDGCEISLAVLDHCGACGVECFIAQGIGDCSAGSCTIASCNAGFDDCNGTVTDGCEGNLSSIENCGQCGHACTIDGGAEPACIDGVCGIAPCKPGFADCNGQMDDGCETAITTLDHCGACNVSCALPHAVSACVAGACKVAQCESPFLNCDQNDANGCEVDSSTNLSNCGACGDACPLANASSASCSQGKCLYACSEGWGDCNGPHPAATADGCELPVSADPMNCGGCSHACSKLNATDVACVSGKCVPSCQQGFLDCGTPAAAAADDGCEANPLIDPGNCGACGLQCGNDHVAQNLCVAGSCAPVCASGWANCDKSPPVTGGNNGCEQDIGSDTNHCGACGRACSGDHVDDKSCSGGVCDSSCDFSWKNCSKPGGDKSDDGCETWGACW